MNKAPGWAWPCIVSVLSQSFKTTVANQWLSVASPILPPHHFFLPMPSAENVKKILLVIALTWMFHGDTESAIFNKLFWVCKVLGVQVKSFLATSCSLHMAVSVSLVRLM